MLDRRPSRRLRRLRPGGFWREAQPLSLRLTADQPRTDRAPARQYSPESRASRLRRNEAGAYTEEHENKAGCWLGPGFTVNQERGPNQINTGCQLKALKWAGCWLRVECLTAPATPSRGAVESSWVLWCPCGAHRLPDLSRKLAGIVDRWSICSRFGPTVLCRSELIPAKTANSPSGRANPV